MFVVNTLDEIREIENLLTENSVFHMLMMYLALTGYEFI